KPDQMGSPLIQAGTTGDTEMMQLLIDRGADVKAAAEPLLVSAITNRCEKCLNMIVAKNPDRDAFTGALQETAVLADVNTVRLLLDHGADVNAFDSAGRTPLMYAAVSDLLAVDVVKLLIDRGADVNAKDRHRLSGDTDQTVLDIAKLHGNTPIVDLLVKAGANSMPQVSPVLKSIRSNTVQAAIQRSVPLLQRSDADFTQKAGCVSCHNDSLPAMATSLARRSGFRVDEEVAAKQVRVNVSFLERFRDRLHQGVFLAQVNDNFGADILGYILIGLDAE